MIRDATVLPLWTNQHSGWPLRLREKCSLERKWVLMVRVCLVTKCPEFDCSSSQAHYSPESNLMKKALIFWYFDKHLGDLLGLCKY